MRNTRSIILYLSPREGADLTQLLQEGFENIEESETPTIERKRRVNNQLITERVIYHPDSSPHTKAPGSSYTAVLYAANLEPSSSITAQLSFWRTMEAYFTVDHARTRVE